MDYINFGIGTGATLALFGWLFRDLGPRIRDRAPREDQVLSARELVSRMAWQRFCSSFGMALTLGGILMLVATLVIAMWNPHDETGFSTLLIVYAAIAILMLVWTGLFLRQFGASGIIRPRQPADSQFVATATQPTTTTTSTSEDTAVQPETEPATQSFEDVASSRGGLSRFAMFFRRDTLPESGTPPGQADESAASPADGEEQPASLSPTDAVIAELSADGQNDGENKRLALHDALVTSVLGDVSPDRAVGDSFDDYTVKDLDSESESHPADVEPADSEANIPPPAEPLTPEDQALKTLRKRRLARLSDASE